MDLDLGTSKFGRHTWDTCNIFIDGPNPTSTSGLIPTYHISGIVTCKDFWKKDNDIPRIYCILYIYIYICLASCTKPLISDVDFLCEGWCVAWTPTSLLPSTKKTATEQWPNPCLLNVFFHFGVIVIPQTDACILYIYIIHMISLHRCRLSFHLPFVVFEGTLIRSYKSIMIWIWNVIICSTFPDSPLGLPPSEAT